MGGYKRTLPTIYLVHWAQAGITKAGYSYKQRWRTFELRGAEVLGLVEFDDHHEAFEFETLMDTGLARLGPPAFGSNAAAEPFLGTRGDGFKECYLVPKTDASALLAALLTGMPPAMHATQRNATNATRSTLPHRNLAFLTVRTTLWITRISREGVA